LFEGRFSDICKQIVGTDESIRFAGIANKMGNLVTTEYQEGIIPLMTKEETSRYAIRAVVRPTTHEDFETKLGRLQYSVRKYEKLTRAADPPGRLKYSIGKYDKLTRATIPVPPAGITDNDDKSKFYLLLTLDIDSDATSIIERKVLPQIERNQEIFN